MSEFIPNKAAIVGASLVLGVGGTVAEKLIGFDIAQASSSTPAVEHFQSTKVNPALPKYGGTLVFSNGQFSSRENTLENLGISNKTSTINSELGTGAYVGNKYRLYDVNGDLAKKKYLKLIKNCGESLGVNLSMKRRDKNALGKLSVSLINSGKREKFSWTNAKNVRFCGLSVETAYYQVYFPNKPTRQKKTGGYFMDTVPYNDQNRASSVNLWLKRKK